MFGLAKGAAITMSVYYVFKALLFVHGQQWELINEKLRKDSALLEETPYGENWICVIEGDDLDAELPQLKIGRSAVAFFQEDIDRFLAFVQKASGTEVSDPTSLCIGAIEKMDDARWDTTVKEFFGH